MVRNGRVGTGIAAILGCMRAFKRDEKGSVTLQVLFFSLMVFGATGIVLDAGRVYDSHSRLQIYADHMAHLAANELDRKEDSISRATNAVYSATDTATALLTGSDSNAGEFKVAKLEFFSDMVASNAVQNDMSEAFPDSLNVATVTATSSDATGEASVEAAFVVVTVASEVSAVTQVVTRTIPNMGYEHPVNTGQAGQRTGVGPDSFNIEVKAAATLERESCAGLTTLVMCNPWEDQVGANDALSVAKPAEGDFNEDYTVPGRSLMFFAPNFANTLVPSDNIVLDGEEIGSLFPWDVHHQLFQIDGPVADPAGVCSTQFLRDLAGNVLTGSASPQEYQDARDRCLMARASAPQVCWSDDNPLTIRPANGDTVLRSVNTIFDIWNAPFEQMVQDATLLDPSGALPFTAADFFQPDRLATTTYETADRFGLPDAALPAQCTVDDPRLVQDGIPDYNLPWPCDDPDTAADESDPANATPDSFQPAYDTIPKPGWTYLAGTRGEGIGYDFCHDKTLGRQDVARQTLQQCLTEAESAGDPVAAEEQCRTDYDLATSFDTCAATATPGRERTECGCEVDFVGDHHQGGAGLYMFARTRSYRGSLYDFGGQDPQTFFPITITGGPMTWFEFYRQQRDLQENNPTIGTQGQRSRVVRWNGDPKSVASDPQDAVEDYGIGLNDASELEGEHSAANAGYVKHFPDDFFALTGQQPSADPSFVLSSAMRVNHNRERRRIQAAMVNCGVVTGLVEDDEGNTRPVNGDGTYNVTLDDMRVMDAYVPNPAGMFCGPNSVDCDVSGSIETSMYIELIEDVTDDVTTDQYTVRLVR